MRDFRKLLVWQKGHEFALAVYRETADFPSDGHYGITSQMRRAASSIPTNIAEGCGRSGETELARFMRIAMGSAGELEYLILLAKDLGYLPIETFNGLQAQTVEIKRMVAPFINRLRGKNQP